MNIRQIRAFHATIVSGSASKAASSLNITQSAVSKLLKNLEETVEYKLFDRINGLLSPTQEARHLFHEVDSTLSQFGRLDDLFKSAKELGQDRIKIGSLPGPSLFFIPHVLGKFLSSHKNLSTSILSRGSQYISDAISCNTLDIGIIDLTGKSPSYDIHKVPTSYYCAIPDDDPLLDKEFITPTDLNGKPLISLPKGQAFYENMERAFQKEDATFKVVHECLLSMTAISMVREGQGYAFIDTLNMWSFGKCLEQQGVIFKPFKPLVQENLGILTPTLRPLSNDILELVELLKTEINEIEEHYNKLYKK